MEEVNKTKQKHQQSKAVLRLICDEISKLDVQRFEKVGVYKALFKAIKYGIEEVIEEVLKCHPYIFWCQDRKGRTILSYAILERQEKIFNLLTKRRNKHVLASFMDKNKNNLLHQAAILPSSTRPDDVVCGAILHMQLELQWYEKVKKIVQPRLRHKTNRDGKSPNALFTDQHKGLVAEAERWAKDTATSCSVVAALIVTMMFAAAFTFPGGYDEKGNPLFLHRDSFAVFMVSVTLSLFSSATSALVFLGILTSRFGERDFLMSLPTKLIIGLGTLFFSIVTMMIAFCSTLVIILEEKWGWVSYPVVLLASGPIALYPLLQFPLLFEILKSTYGNKEGQQIQFSSFIKRK